MTNVNPYSSTGGYLVGLKDSLVQSLRTAFPPTCPWPNFANLYVDLSYPQEKIDYPGIWVDFEPVGNVTRGGLDQPYAAVYGSDGYLAAVSRWRAQGYATFTIGALSSLERDLLYDIMISMIAFSYQAPYESFRYALEVINPLMAVMINSDTISNRGSAERPTDEWGGPDVVYETTIAIELAVEFGVPVPTVPPGTLSAIDVAVTTPGGVVDADLSGSLYDQALFDASEYDTGMPG